MSERSPQKKEGCVEGQAPDDVAVFFASQPQRCGRIFASQPKSSTSPYKQQERAVFEAHPQKPGTIPSPEITLLPSFRAAAPKSNLIWAFTQAMDKMASGLVDDGHEVCYGDVVAKM
ncbi:hypothetical protein V8E54_004190 [Elaphomyces granulatus]